MLLFLLILFSWLTAFSSALSWNAIEYMIVFGDSYSTEGYDITKGLDSPPVYTSSDGPNWVEYLSDMIPKVIQYNFFNRLVAGTYNQTAVKTFNLAYGGATIDSALVAPYTSTVLSVVDQVSLFNKYLASKPTGAQWSGTDTLVAIWIGINDVATSAGWTNVSLPQFYGTLMDRLFSQMDNLYQAGARNFLFMTVPPIERTPLFLRYGSHETTQLRTAVAEYNKLLTERTRSFQEKYTQLSSVILLDTQPVFNSLLDNGQTFGFVDIGGYCDAYIGGTSTRTYQAEGCAPVSSYFWLNSLHPVFTVHDILAKAISTALVGYPSIQIST